MNTPERFARLAEDHELGSNANNYANLNSKPRPEPGLSFWGVLVLVAFVLWLIVGAALSAISGGL